MSVMYRAAARVSLITLRFLACRVKRKPNINDKNMINKIERTELSLNKQSSLFNFVYVLFWNLIDARVFDIEKQDCRIESYFINLTDSFTKYTYDYHQSISTNTNFKSVVMHRNDTAMMIEGCEGFYKGYDYFGTRYYDSDLSIWLSVDPLNILYPNLSPYSYCDNNPVYFTDPDGRKIEPHGSDAFKQQYYKDLEMLKKTDRGKEIVAFLQSPSFQINIYESAWTKSGFDPDDNSVYYDNDNAFDYNYDGVEYVSFISLGHELQHAYDKYKMKGYKDASRVKKETSAVYFENYLRSVYKYELASRGIPFALRYTYTKGTSLFWGRVLISGKSTTLFNSNKKENYFNSHLERLNHVSPNIKNYTLGDRHIQMISPPLKSSIKSYENKNSSKHGTVLYL